MRKNKQSKAPARIIDAKTARAAAKVAGIAIPEERLADAAARLSEMLGFLDQLEMLEIEDIPPAAVFDPSWEPR